MKLLIGGGLFIVSQVFIWNIATGSLNKLLLGVGEIMLVGSLFLMFTSKELK